MQDRHSENNESLEEFFRKGFESHEERPPDEVWNNIAAFLGAKQKTIQVEKSFFKQHWGKMLIGAALIGSFALWYMATEKKETIPVQPEKKIDTVVYESPLKASEHVEPDKNEKVKKRGADKQQKPLVPDNKEKGSSAILKREKLEVSEPEPEQEVMPEPQPPAKEVEEEPGNLYDQMKKEQKGMKPLFIEKKKYTR